MISLKNYVKRRNGVPLGHFNSLENMLKRSLGAKSFDLFWAHWNPIWNYYLNRYVFKPLKQIINNYLAIVLTFCFSGLLHDLVGLLIYKRISLLITTWFTIMGIIAVISKYKKIQYSKNSSITAYAINIAIILGCFCLTKFLIFDLII